MVIYFKTFLLHCIYSLNVELFIKSLTTEKVWKVNRYYFANGLFPFSSPRPTALSFKFVPQRDPSFAQKKKKNRKKKRMPSEVDACSWCATDSKMDNDKTVRRIKSFGTHNYTVQDNDGSRHRRGFNGFSEDPKRKPEVSLYLLREGLGAFLVIVFILVLWGLVHLSLRQLVIGKPTGEFSPVRARWV